MINNEFPYNVKNCYKPKKPVYTMIANIIGYTLVFVMFTVLAYMWLVSLAELN